MQPRAYVGRQPIYDGASRVFGYELLFRSLGDDADVTGEEMTSRVMVHAAIDVGLANIVGTRAAFVNLTRPFLTGALPVPFPPGQTVLEVLESVVVDDALLDGIRGFKAAGYQIALDDFAFDLLSSPLLGLADLVKVDVRDWPLADLPKLVAEARSGGCRAVVAEKIETMAEYAACREAGFDLYQGYLLSRPAVVTSTSLDATRLHSLQLMMLLTQPDTPIGEVDQLVRRDPGLVYRVLRAANSAATGRSRQVKTVREAVTMLGLRQLQTWLTLILAAQLDDDSDGERGQEMIARARMCELVAAELPRCSTDAAFAVGLVSKLDRLLGQPITDIVARLPLHDEIVTAVVDRTGPLGEVLDCAEGYEMDRLPPRLAPSLTALPLADLYLSALTWAFQASRQVA